MASPGFFQMFDFEVLQGSTEEALSKPSAMVITQRMKEKYFGNEEAVGNTLSLPIAGEDRPFDIVAVLENIPSNSSLQFDFLHYRIFHGVYSVGRICHLDRDIYFVKNIYPDKIGGTRNHFFRHLHDGFFPATVSV